MKVNFKLFWNNYFDLNVSFFSKKKEVGKPHIHVSGMKQSIVTYLRDSGWEVKLQNTVYSLLTRWDINYFCLMV